VLDAVGDRFHVRSLYEGMMPRNLWCCGEFEEALAALDRGGAEADHMAGFGALQRVELRARILASLHRWDAAEEATKEALRRIADLNLKENAAITSWIDAFERLRGEIRQRTFEPP
jgi:hypothetical protein